MPELRKRALTEYSSRWGVRRYSLLICLCLLTATASACDWAAIVGGRISLPALSRRGFADLSPIVRTQLDEAYQRGASQFQRLGGSGSAIGGLDLTKNPSAVDDHTRIVLELGGRIEGSKSNAPRLLPARKIDAIFIRSGVQVERWLREGKLLIEEVLLPALPFFNSTTGEWLFVRPGIDPVPAEPFVLRTLAPQIPHKVFYRAVAEGKLPFFPDRGFLAHDLGHLTDVLSDPEIMRQMVAYGKWLVAQPTAKNEGEWWPGGYARPLARSLILAEAFDMPDITRRKEYLPLIRHFGGSDGPVDYLGEVAYLSRLPVDVIKQHAERILDRDVSSFLLLHGGGMRDGYSTEKFSSETHIRAKVSRDLAQKSGSTPTPAGVVAVAVGETLTGQRTYLGWLMRLRHDTDAVLKEWEENGLLKPVSSTSRAAKQENAEIAAFREAFLLNREKTLHQLDTLIIETIARWETSVFLADRDKLTVRDVYRAARLQAPPDGPARRFLRASAAPGSLREHAFELDSP